MRALHVFVLFSFVRTPTRRKVDVCLLDSSNTKTYDNSGDLHKKKRARVESNRGEGDPLPLGARYFDFMLVMSWRARVVDVCLLDSSNTTYANSNV